MGLVVTASALAAAVGWVQWPRPPELDGERWFKVMIATLLRGRVEADGGSPDAWEEAVLRWVPYHPAGRLPERKASNPVAAAMPDLAMDGEVALLEQLARFDDGLARFRWMYLDDEVGAVARLADPADLGEAYDPATTLGPGASWDSLAAWGAATDDAFARAALRAADATWVLVEGRADRQVGPSVLPSLQEVLGDAAVRIPYDDGDVASLGAALHERASAGQRLVAVAEEAGTVRLLRALLAQAEVRDQLLAVVSVGGAVMGRADEEGVLGRATCRDWMEAHFGQHDFDTDVVRLTPYFSVQWLDPVAWPPGVSGLPLECQRFVEPHERGATATTVEVVDLGPLLVERPSDWVIAEGLPDVPSQLDPELVARALIGVVSAWTVHRR